MKEIDPKFEGLVTADLTGELSFSEKKELENWLNASRENQEYYAERERIIYYWKDLQKMEKIDANGAFRKLSNQLFNNPRERFIRIFQRAAAILIIPALVASIWMYVAHEREQEFLSSIYQTFETPLGMRSKLTLPDGSQVWLNAGSSIRYPMYSEEGERRVEIQGEVYFEVTKIEGFPFYVNAGDAEIKVLGTKFNCSAYPESDIIQTALVEGSVMLTNTTNKKQFVMSPGELAELTKSTNSLTKTKARLDKYIAWKSGKLIFRDDPMELVVEKLERWYNVEIKIVDPEIKDYIYTATFDNETLEQVLNMLEISAPIKSHVDERVRMQNGSYKKQTIYLYNKS